MQPDVRQRPDRSRRTGVGSGVEFIHDITKALQYEVLQMPALIIDEKAVSFGRDLSVDEIKEILKKYR